MTGAEISGMVSSYTISPTFFRSPCHPSLDLELLAENFEITGANIRNIALTAAFLAADDGQVIEMGHLIRAMRREYQKNNKQQAIET